MFYYLLSIFCCRIVCADNLQNIFLNFCHYNWFILFKILWSLLRSMCTLHVFKLCGNRLFVFASFSTFPILTIFFKAMAVFLLFGPLGMFCFSSQLVHVVQSLSRVWLCELMDWSMPGFPVLHYLLEFAQIHRVNDAIQPSFSCGTILLIHSIAINIFVSTYWLFLCLVPWNMFTKVKFPGQEAYSA